MKNFTKMKRQDFEKKLFERFDPMYGNHKLPMEQTCMCWGLEHGSGWYNLIWEISEKIEKEIKKDKSLEIFRVSQVKEKFATLRFYYEGNWNDKIEKLIDEAEKKSEQICEQCGKDTGKSNIKGNGWLYNRCDECYEKMENK